MFKDLRVLVLTILAAGLFFSWLVMDLQHIKGTQANYWWQAGLAGYTVLGGLLGLSVAKNWSGLKSGVGRAIIFLSLGLVTWGVAQAGWAYFTLKGEEEPSSAIVSIIYLISIPLWSYGIFQLSRATGAKYGWRSNWAKMATAQVALGLLILSYFMLVTVARGGNETFNRPLWDVFYDLGYAFGDVLLLTASVSIFGLSWKFLGGRFKKPVLLILSAFVLQYIADFSFSYYDGKSQYYNGHWCDAVYLAVMAILSIALCTLNPRSSGAKSIKNVSAPDSESTISVKQPPLTVQMNGASY